MADRSLRWWNMVTSPLKQRGVEIPGPNDTGLCAIADPVETREGWATTPDGKRQRGVFVTAFIALPEEPQPPISMNDRLDVMLADRHAGAFEAAIERLRGKVI